MNASPTNFGAVPGELERLEALDVHTEVWRREKAAQHSRTATHAYAQGHLTRAKWHRDRARGLRRRIENVGRCGSFQVKRWCGSCGADQSTVPATCGNWRICESCRGAYQARYRERFESARARELRRGQPLGVSEKFVTLTIPHIEPVQDARVLTEAFGRFREMLMRYLIKYRGIEKRRARRLAYVRVLELTPGSERDGHAHLHLWAMLPFIDKRVLAVLWWRALPFEYRWRCAWVELDGSITLSESDRKAIGRRLQGTSRPSGNAAIPYPSVDIQGVTDGVANELIKYLVKNRKDGEYIEPELEAELYQAMDGRRAVSTARGFWTDVCSLSECAECGVLGERFEVRLELSPTGLTRLDESARQARAPPPDTSFVHTRGISPSVVETLREFDESCAQTGSFDSSWRDEPGWARNGCDPRGRYSR